MHQGSLLEYISFKTAPPISNDRSSVSAILTKLEARCELLSAKRKASSLTSSEKSALNGPFVERADFDDESLQRLFEISETLLSYQSVAFSSPHFDQRNLLNGAFLSSLPFFLRQGCFRIRRSWCDTYLAFAKADSCWNVVIVSVSLFETRYIKKTQLAFHPSRSNGWKRNWTTMRAKKCEDVMHYWAETA